MFYDSRNGYQFSGSTAVRDFDVSLSILKWSLVMIMAIACVASFNGCHGF